VPFYTTPHNVIHSKAFEHNFSNISNTAQVLEKQHYQDQEINKPSTTCDTYVNTSNYNQYWLCSSLFQPYTQLYVHGANNKV